MQFLKSSATRLTKEGRTATKKRTKASTDEEEFVRCDLLQRGVAADSAFLQHAKIEFLDTIKTVFRKT